MSWQLPAASLDFKTCSNEFRISETNERPYFWNNALWTVADQSLLFDQEELKDRSNITFIDSGQLKDSSHASSVLSVFCKSRECDLDLEISLRKIRYSDTNPQLSLFGNDRYDEYFRNEIEEVIEHNRKSPDDPITTISISMNAFRTDNPDNILLLKQLETQNMTNIIWSAGNSPGKIHSFFEKNKMPENLQVISALDDSKTHLWQGSGYGNGISFAMPSGTYLKTSNSDSFGATSGAAPQAASFFHSLASLLKHNGIFDAKLVSMIAHASTQKIGPSEKFGDGLLNLPLAVALTRALLKNKDLLLSQKYPEIKSEIEKIRNEHLYDENFKNRPHCLKGESSISTLLGQLTKPINHQKTHCVSCSEEIKNVPSFQEAESCRDLLCQLDTLNYLNLISNSHDEVIKDELCKRYRKMENLWGVKNYCDTGSISEKEVKQMIDSDIVFAAQVLFKKDIHPFDHPAWYKRYQDLLKDSDGALIILRGALNDPKFQKHPNFNSEITKLLLQNNKRMDNRLVENIFSKPSFFKEHDLAPWLDLLIKNKHTLNIGEYLLPQPEFFKKYPQYYPLFEKENTQNFINHMGKEKWYWKEHDLNKFITDYQDVALADIGEYVIGKFSSKEELQRIKNLDSLLDKFSKENGSTFAAHLLSNPFIMEHLGESRWKRYVADQIEKQPEIVVVWIMNQENMANRLDDTLIEKLLEKDPYKMFVQYLSRDFSKKNPSWEKWLDRVKVEAKKEGSWQELPPKLKELIQSER